MRSPPTDLSETQRHAIHVIEEQTRELGHLLETLQPPPAPNAVALARPPEPGVPAFPSQPRILLADDNDDILTAVGDLLASDYHLTFAQDGAQALAALRLGSFDLAIFDLSLPVFDGFQIVEALREAEVPTPAFMFLSGWNDPEVKVHALALGAADYVTKPFEPDELLARVARIMTTVTREASLRADAMTDPLTGIANYRSFSQSLEREVERSRRYGLPLSLLAIDLDHLKALNDAHGHDCGNEALCIVARVLEGAVRRFEVVARQGGDEFAIILPNTAASEARQLAERLCTEVAAQSLRGTRLSASIGGASREDATDIDAAGLMRASDEALYRAKRAGRNRVEMDHA
jgi:diguanylate cyclase (GGDEF)-like protein